MRYSQNQDKIGFFSNVKTVCPLPVVRGGDAGPSRGPGNHPLTPRWHQDARNGKIAAKFRLTPYKRQAKLQHKEYC